MAKDNIADGILSQLMKSIDDVSNYVSDQYKNVKPFDRAKVDSKEVLFNYDQLSPMDMAYLVDKHGNDKVNEFIHDMEMKRSKGVK